MDGGTKQQQCFSHQLRPGVKVLGGGEEENGPSQCLALTDSFSPLFPNPSEKIVWGLG